jgi:aspartate/methionine/tyrosine aminotransferase
MQYRRMPIEIESPEQMGYGNIECNLTESSFADATLEDLKLNMEDLVLCYGSHTGKTELREFLASESPGLQADDFLITAGAAAALFIVSTSLLKSGDRILVAKPNYATNIETPRAIGAAVDFLELKFEEGFRLNFDQLKSQLTPETKLVSLTFPQNPTGSHIKFTELQEIVQFLESRNILLLFDETYREMSFGEILNSAAELSSKVIGVSSLSKTYGLPGIRIGWLACRAAALRETFLAAKEQILICNSVIDEEIALKFLEKKKERLPEIQKKIQFHFEIIRNWMNSQQYLEWVEPSGGVICFPRIRKDYNVNVDSFYKILNDKYKTFVGPGHWFEMDRRYMRIGYGWPKTDELRRGLQNITRALKEARNEPPSR